MPMQEALESLERRKILLRDANRYLAPATRAGTRPATLGVPKMPMF